MNIVAIIKHISIKNSNYNAATDYLTLKHDEFTNKMILDEMGNPIPRENIILSGINCEPFSFGAECEATNALYHKNQTRDEIKAHHYILSFDPRDRDENGLTLEAAHTMVVTFAKKNFPGHQTIICAHPDGHSSSGNIHVHIVINSIRKLDVEEAAFMERPGDSKAGNKHHVTNQFLEYLKQETMSMCQENSLYQVDLLNPAKVRITDREYWAQRKGQAALDKENEEKKAKGITPNKITYKTQKQILRDSINATLSDCTSFEDFTKKLLENYGIGVHESRGKLSFILPDREKPIRGRQLGTDFEKDHILEVITDNTKSISPDLSNASPGKYQSSGIRLIVDIEQCIKAQPNQYYARKVKIGNLQQMASTLTFLKQNDIESITALDELLSSTSDDVNAKHTALKSTEAELTKVNLLIKNTGQYLANKEVYRQYLQSKNKKNFREEHRAELSLYEAARDYLKENAPDKTTKDGKAKFSTPSIKQLKEQKATLTSKKNLLYEEYSYARAKYRELQTVSQNVHDMLDIPKSKMPEKDKILQKERTKANSKTGQSI